MIIIINIILNNNNNGRITILVVTYITLEIQIANNVIQLNKVIL